MDFAMPYTEEQERFRQEVRSWLVENVPEDMKEPVDPADFTEEHYRFWRQVHQKLGAIGWLHPTSPKEYGGGGLSGDHETIIEEELLLARAIPPFGGLVPRMSGSLLIPILMVWATEEQKQKFLVPLLKGEVATWQKYTEPSSGADLADYQSRAVRDGDDWLLTGQNVFISGRGTPDYLYGPMMTDSDAPRHRNLGFFVIPVPSAGLEITEMELVNGKEQHAIFLENVRVPGNHLIGGDHKGWQVANTGLEQEHGGRGQAFPSDEMVDRLVSYVQDTKRDGNALGGDFIVQQAAMEAYIESRVDSLMAKRTNWMYQNRLDIQYQGNVANVHHREHQLRNAIRVRSVMGIYAHLGSKDSLAPQGGAQEVHLRYLVGQRHAGGSTNIAKVILARRIGVSRTQERAAPTPSSTASPNS